MLNELFDYRYLNRTDEIERLEKRLGELKERNQSRLQNKEKIIENHLKEMLSDGNMLEW